MLETEATTWTPPDCDPAVRVEGLTLGFDGLIAVDDVHLTVDPGEVVGVLGRNGAGKTTLLRLIAGLLHPDEGEVRVFGQCPVRDALSVRRRLGYVSEHLSLPDSVRVDRWLGLHRELFVDWDLELEAELTKRFRLGPKQRVEQLSKGQRQQLFPHLRLAHRPPLLILDEPASGLDPAARRGFLEASLELLADGGTTILFSSHHLSDVERLANRVLVLDEGVLLLDGTLDGLREQLALVVVRDTTPGERRRIRERDDFVSFREHAGALHVLLRQPHARAADTLAVDAPGRALSCAPLALEELFIELLGDSE